MDDKDSPWKEVLDWLFEAFMDFSFPKAYADIDWPRGFEFLDKELRQIVKEAELGGRVVDKLVKVWLKNGAEEWLLIHIEIQTTWQAGFPQRVFVYHYRIFDRYNRKVVSLAILADDHPKWRPNKFGYELWDFSIEMKFPILKLLDYADRTEELAKNPNPFAMVVLAHLKAMETRRDPEDRRRWKMILVRSLYERGWSGDQVRKLFRFIDWIMALPKDLEESFWQEFRQFEEAKRMPFITSVERIGIEKGLAIGRAEGREEGRQEGRQEGHQEGRREGLVEAVCLGMELRFPGEAAALMPDVAALREPASLEAVLRAVWTSGTIDDFRAVLRQFAPCTAVALSGSQTDGA